MKNLRIDIRIVSVSLARTMVKNLGIQLVITIVLSAGGWKDGKKSGGKECPKLNIQTPCTV